MLPNFEEPNEALQELPPELVESLKQFSRSGTDEDLDGVILSALRDLGVIVPDNKLNDNTHLFDDLDLDSLTLAEFIFFFEDVFKVKITNEDLANIRKIGELRLFLRKNLF